MKDLTTSPTKEELEAARMATFLLAPRSAEAKEFTQFLAKQTEAYEVSKKLRQRARRAKDQQTFKLCVGALAADLIAHSRHEEAAGHFYRSSNRQGFIGSLMTSTNFDHLTTRWEDMGWLTKTKYYAIREDFDGEPIPIFRSRARRYRATTTFINLAQQFGIDNSNLRDHFAKRHDTSVPVEVRPAKGVKLPRSVSLTDPKSRHEEIRYLNSKLEVTSTNFPEPPQLIRKFNRGDLPSFNFNHGGRLYAAGSNDWQNIDKDERLDIELSGQRVVEIDVRASQLSILYALCGATLDQSKDPYHIPKVERDLVKALIVTMIGQGGMPTRWPSKLPAAYQEKFGIKLQKAHKLKNVVGSILGLHPVLRRLRPVALDWGRLQYEESEAILSTLVQLQKDYEIPALPVHDSIIVPADADLIAGELLKNQYEDRFGFRPEIRRMGPQAAAIASS